MMKHRGGIAVTFRRLHASQAFDALFCTVWFIMADHDVLLSLYEASVGG
jgi:hypothetical protein